MRSLTLLILLFSVNYAHAFDAERYQRAIEHLDSSLLETKSVSCYDQKNSRLVESCIQEQLSLAVNHLKSFCSANVQNNDNYDKAMRIAKGIAGSAMLDEFIGEEKAQSARTIAMNIVHDSLKCFSASAGLTEKK